MASLLARHIAFVEALRAAGLPVSLSEGLDAVHAIADLGLADRETLRATYAATLVKRQPDRPGLEHVFDLYFPALMGDGFDSPGLRAASACELSVKTTADADGPEQLAEF